MNELEWLKEQSGLSDEEIKAFEGIAGTAKLTTFLRKVVADKEAAEKAAATAKGELTQFTERYNNEFVPSMRNVTQESIATQGRIAALEAKLAKAKEYGIVIDEVDPKADPEPKTTPRAPGSPNPDAITRDDFGRFQNSQSAAVITLQELNAEHFELYGKPLSGTQELIAEVNRQHLLGNRGFTLRNAWETKHNVGAKRQELAAAAQKKHDDEVRSAAIKEERERHGSNPNVRTGVPSRFSNYKASDATNTKEPWKAPRGQRERNAGWRQSAQPKLRDAVAA